MNLKHTPCDCAEWRRLNEACADLLRERDQLKKLIAEKDANLGKRICQYTRCIQFAELQAERDEWKRRAKMMHEWMQQRQYYHHAAPWLLFMQDHLPHAPDGWFNNA